MQKLIVILGTNASGKSTIGIKLAKQFNCETALLKQHTFITLQFHDNEV